MIVALALFKLGAVNVTLLPLAALSVPLPLTTFQFTASLKPFAPVTVALSAVLAAASSVVLVALAVTALTLEAGGGGGITITVAVAVLPVSCTLIAVTVNVVWSRTAGAVRRVLMPLLADKVPPEVVQVTSVSAPFVPLTLAISKVLPRLERVLSPLVIVIAVIAGGGLLHALTPMARTTATTTRAWNGMR
jgi:hypothetical protein